MFYYFGRVKSISCCSDPYLPTYLLTYPPTHLPTYPPTHLPTYLPTHPPTHLPTHPPLYLPIYLPTHPPTYPPTHLPTYSSTHLPTYPPTYLPTYPPTYLSIYLSGDTNLAPRKNSSGANDVMSMFVHVLSFEFCTILRTFVCRESLLWTVADTEDVDLKFEVRQC